MIYSLSAVCGRAFTLFIKLKAPQDYFGGIVLIGAGAYYRAVASSDLAGHARLSRSAVPAPRATECSVGVMLALGAAIAMVGLSGRWSAACDISLAWPAVRVAVDPVLCDHDPAAGPGGFGVRELHHCGAGNARDAWKETIIVGICLTIGCSLLFPYALGCRCSSSAFPGSVRA